MESPLGYSTTGRARKRPTLPSWIIAYEAMALWEILNPLTDTTPIRAGHGCHGMIEGL
jgi:hypothetical protein